MRSIDKQTKKVKGKKVRNNEVKKEDKTQEREKNTRGRKDVIIMVKGRSLSGERRVLLLQKDTSESGFLYHFSP